MSLSSIIQVGVPIAAATAFGFWVTPGPWTRKAPAEITVADIVADAPLNLRHAVFLLTDREQTDLMLANLGLGSYEHGFPLVDRWDYDRHGLTVDVLMLGGQSLDDWADDKMRSRLATYLGAEQVTVTSPASSWVRLQVRVHDTLAATAALPPAVHSAVDLEAVPIGVREDGLPWLVKLMYRHWLVAGCSDSGKGSVLWSIVAGVGPAIKAGLVDVWLGDPKGGMEFGRGEGRLWKRFHCTADGITEMLAEAVSEMQERAARFKEAGIRKFVPSVDEPLNVLIIDEYAAMSAFATKQQFESGMRDIGLLLTQGRAVGWSVIVAVQDPSKETMPNRQLFTARIGLRLDEPSQNNMVHGQGAKDRGARCDEISEHTPGVGYVGENGTTDFVRVRAFWIQDHDADAIVDAYSPAPAISGPAEDYTGFDPDDLGDDDIPGDGYAGPAVAA